MCVYVYSYMRHPLQPWLYAQIFSRVFVGVIVHIYVSVCMCARRLASLTTSAIRVHNKLNATFHNKIKNAK